MPEVVEVCLTALFLNHKLSGKYLSEIEVLGGRYSGNNKIENLTYFQNNKPFKINKIDSKGKFLWFELINDKDKKCYIMNTFGLAGEWKLIPDKHSDIKFQIKDNNKNKIYDFYFDDPRHFGTIEISPNDKNLNKKLSKLGPDFLKISYTNQEFHERIKNFMTKCGTEIVKEKANKEIVKVLMDQTCVGGIGSGLGNYLVTECIYDAGISPYTKIKDIYEDKKLSDKLSHSIKYILKLAFLTEDVGYMEHLDKKMSKFILKIREEIKKDKNHKFNIHPDIHLKENDKFEFKVYRQKKDPHGNDVKVDKIIPGRTTYWSPTIQK